MKILLLSVGTIKKSYMSSAIEDYLKRIKRYTPLDVLSVKDETLSVKMPRGDVLKREGARIAAKLKDGDYIISLTDSGEGFTSHKFSEKIERILASTGITARRIVFIVGGAYGLDEDIIARSNISLSLSKMTLPHELARLVLAEQIYRAFTIMRSEPYSH
ncbi:MAG: 23S rRNA (pseudouridine(1915)-N(3))-methyltransferase RlmH [Deltaproteobacteria bacterium]|nr:23S rRNA (pseudouridine(1915)-N(3))-methyltransferase RlmH [Deltaproteobacteria bacterium]